MLTVTRDGEEVDLDITTGDDEQGGSTLGVLINPTHTFPVDIHIEISDIGGSSAGTMFALGIMDRLTPGDQTGGEVIAGTGTMDLDGNVGPIGGIVQKMNGSVRDGAEYFLAPAANCADVVGNVPDGLQVIRVETLDEAWTAVQAVGTDEAADLPTCS
ncbi:S16 family serine protease [Serinibacter arcticus]|uniref:S16 family serine protease n=1 Tax=Serinibacter arcticus TaxID=1655435 RepID=UPI001F30B500|nr:S16 family serine protease [Serinibacter arcticus]